MSQTYSHSQICSRLPRLWASKSSLANERPSWGWGWTNHRLHTWGLSRRKKREGVANTILSHKNFQFIVRKKRKRLGHDSLFIWLEWFKQNIVTFFPSLNLSPPLAKHELVLGRGRAEGSGGWQLGHLKLSPQAATSCRPIRVEDGRQLANERLVLSRGSHRRPFPGNVSPPLRGSFSREQDR